MWASPAGSSAPLWEGEEMWFYTCAFPAGAIMNRSMDLPLTASRAVMWMGALYRLSGFLHWGFNYYIGDDIWHSACCPHKGALLPAGDLHIVYPGDNGGPWRSMRFEALHRVDNGHIRQKFPEHGGQHAIGLVVMGLGFVGQSLRHAALPAVFPDNLRPG